MTPLILTLQEIETVFFVMDSAQHTNDTSPSLEHNVNSQSDDITTTPCQRSNTNLCKTPKDATGTGDNLLPTESSDTSMNENAGIVTLFRESQLPTTFSTQIEDQLRHTQSLLLETTAKLNEELAKNRDLIMEKQNLKGELLVKEYEMKELKNKLKDSKSSKNADKIDNIRKSLKLKCEELAEKDKECESLLQQIQDLEKNHKPMVPTQNRFIALTDDPPTTIKSKPSAESQHGKSPTSTNDKAVYNFRSEYDELSPFFPEEMMHKGKTFPSSEQTCITG